MRFIVLSIKAVSPLVRFVTNWIEIFILTTKVFFRHRNTWTLEKIEVAIILCSNSYISKSQIDAEIRCIKCLCAPMYYSVINTSKSNKTESSI